MSLLCVLKRHSHYSPLRLRRGVRTEDGRAANPPLNPLPARGEGKTERSIDSDHD
jgi:hypothetical protein